MWTPFEGDATAPIDAHAELPADRRPHWADAMSVQRVIDRRWRELE
jgi:hypothetical protein